jgi:hypothetical protein
MMEHNLKQTSWSLLMGTDQGKYKLTLCMYSLIFTDALTYICRVTYYYHHPNKIRVREVLHGSPASDKSQYCGYKVSL